MFQRKRSFSVLYGIQRTLLAVFYLVSVLSLFWIIFYLLDDVLGLQGVTIILITIIYLVLVVLAYSFIHVVSYIPSNLAGAFDPVQNAIADGSIQSTGDLTRELSAFMVTFFNFAFFDIEYALVKIRNDRSSWPAEMDPGDVGMNIGELDRRNEKIRKLTERLEAAEEFIQVTPAGMYPQQRQAYQRWEEIRDRQVSEKEG